MTNDAPWTIKRLLEWTTSYLERHQSQSARLDAEVLLAHCRDCERIDLYAGFDQIPDAEVLDRFRALVRERARLVPVAYLVGHREFYSLSFKVTRDVLIPRPETEFLVVEALDAARAFETQSENPCRILDMGVGSGCVAIALAKHLPTAQFVGIDLSAEALAVAQHNAQKHAVADRFEWIQSDILTAWPAGRTVDMIVSNPPYIGPQERETLMPDVIEHEPELALIAPHDGMAVIERLIDQATEVLVPGGDLLFEIGPGLAQRVETMVQSSPAWELLGIRPDLDQNPRVVKCRRVVRG